VSPAPARRSGETSFVGRSGEIEALDLAFRRVVRQRAGSLVTILGSAGVGKSALIGTFLASLEGVTIASGRCLAYGREISFWPIAEIVRQLAGLAGGERGATVLSRLEELVGDDPEASFIAKQVAAVIGAGAVSATPDELHWAIRRFIESVASEEPLVLVFDDMHWADETLLELLSYLATWIKDAPVLLLCAARAELLDGRPSWGRGRVDAVNLSLDTLPEADAGEMIRQILGGELDGEVGRAIHEATEGHPLFIRELLSMLRDDGALVKKDGRWVAVSGVTSLPIPPTVRAVLEARMDRSSVSQRRVLEVASVVGRDFTLADLLAFGEAEDLPRILDELIERDLVVGGGGSRTSRAYRFRHILLRDAAYGGMAKELRARVHESFASALEAREEERIAGYDEIVGYHLESAHAYQVELGGEVDPSLADRATTHLGVAAARALELEDMPAAASLAARARALIEADDARYPETAWIEAVALFDLGRTAEMEEVLEAGMRAARELGDESMEWRLRVEHLDVRLWLVPGGQHSRAAREAIGAFERLGDATGLARAHRLLGDALHFENRFDEAARVFAEGRRLALEAGDDREAAQRPAAGVVHGPMPVPACIEIVEASMASAPRPNPDGMGALALLYAMDGRPDEARDVAERAVTRARELGEWRAAAVEMYAAVAYLTMDDPVAADAVARPAVEALRAIGERNLLPTAAALLGEARSRLGDAGEAMALSSEAEHSAAPDDHIANMQWRSLRAMALSAQGRFEEAEGSAREACRIAREQARDVPHVAGDAFLQLSRVLEGRGRVDEAAEAAAEALARYRAKGDRTSASKAEAARERLRLEAGRSSASEG
jgi:tetratricopeptide (TPR) repeat protein